MKQNLIEVQPSFSLSCAWLSSVPACLDSFLLIQNDWLVIVSALLLLYELKKFDDKSLTFFDDLNFCPLEFSPDTAISLTLELMSYALTCIRKVLLLVKIETSPLSTQKVQYSCNI